MSVHVTECCGRVPDLGITHDECPGCGEENPDTRRKGAMDL